MSRKGRCKYNLRAVSNFGTIYEPNFYRILGSNAKEGRTAQLHQQKKRIAMMCNTFGLPQLRLHQKGVHTSSQHKGLELEE